jgi:hypothetical protein
VSIVIQNAARPRRAARRGCLAGVFLFGLVMIAPLMAGLVGIWPGVLKLTAPILCDEGYDDTVVARDTYRTGPGETSTTFTMYCVNERGEATDEGAFRPIAIVFGVLVAAYVLIVVIGLIVAVTKRGRMGPDIEPMPTIVTSSAFGAAPTGPWPANAAPPPPPTAPWQQPPG